MSTFDEDLPPLDCHAHVAADVLASEVDALRGATVFAMTRSLDEAEFAIAHGDPRLTWAAGVHPAAGQSLRDYDAERFVRLAGRVAVVGEVGLHKRRPDLELQQRVFRDIVERSASESVLLSIHSAGAVAAVLDELSKRPRAGYLLHWFLGGRGEIETAARLGCYFSVSAAMDHARLAAFPRERVIPETDFPAGGRRAGAQPGDTVLLERRLAALWSVPPEEVRPSLYRNLRHVAVESGAVERLSERIRDLLLLA